MRTLIVEDEFTSRLLLQRLLAPYGETHIAADGKEAIEAFSLAREENAPYNLICLDIMMPEMDGQEVLKTIGKMEEDHGIYGLDGVRIITTTALDDNENIMEAFKAQCEAYMIKPIYTKKLFGHLESLGLPGKSQQ